MRSSTSRIAEEAAMLSLDAGLNFDRHVGSSFVRVRILHRIQEDGGRQGQRMPKAVSTDPSSRRHH